MRSVYRFNKKANLMIFHIIFKSRSNYVLLCWKIMKTIQSKKKDNNENRINEMASM
jgi:hypothetical protein